MKIYIDILIITNAILTMAYLQTFSRLTHRNIRNGRLFLSSVCGGLFSLILIFDSATFFSAVVITLIKGVGIVLSLLIGCKFSSVTDFIRGLFSYTAIRLAYTAVILLYWQLSSSKRIYAKNYTTYFDISLFKLIAAVITAYTLLTIYELISRRRLDKSVNYRAVYKNGEYELRLPAVADSGNRLCDSFTGTPVVIFCCSEMYYHYNLQDYGNNPACGFRLIPYNTVSGDGLVAVTPKGTVTISDDEGNERDVNCYVGVINAESGKSRAIFNPVLLK